MVAYMLQSSIDFDIFFLYMMERRAWTEEQDLYLRETLQKNTVTKWNQVSRLLQLDYGVKGRTPKECRLRYTSQLETSQPKKEWSFYLEQRMMSLHNDLGNKWAVIGHRMGGISDNAIKNHFYSLMRRALRKLNIVIAQEFPKEVKEFKPTVLYRIVEVADERTKDLSSNELEFANSSHDLKNDLLDFAYDQNIQETEEPEIDLELAKDLIVRVSDFMRLYKKRGRKSRKSSGQGQNLLNCRRFDRRSNVEQQDDSSSNIQEDDMEGEYNSDKTKPRKTSHLTSTTDKMIQEAEPLGMRTRARSQGNVTNKFVEKPNFSMSEEIPEVQEGEGTTTENKNLAEGGNISDHLQIEGILSGYQLLEEAPPPPKLALLKRESSYSRLSLSGQRHDMDFHFFDQSNFLLNGLPQMDGCLKKESQVDENIFG